MRISDCGFKNPSVLKAARLSCFFKSAIRNPHSAIPEAGYLNTAAAISQPRVWTRGGAREYHWRMTNAPPQTPAANPLRAAQVCFVGVGVMAEAMIAGLLRRQLVSRTQIVGSHPRAARREEMQTQY